MVRLSSTLLADRAAGGARRVAYELRFPNAAHHEAEVRATFRGVGEDSLEVVMSRSSPGRYALHEFAKNVYNFRAMDSSGKRMPVERPNPYQWNLRSPDSTIVVEYTLFGDRADGTYNAIDPSHAHLNPPAAFAWARGFEKTPVSLKIRFLQGPIGPSPRSFHADPGKHVVCTEPGCPDGRPLEIGPHTIREWSIGGQQFRLALHFQGADDLATRYARMCEAVVLEEEGVFGALPKYDNGAYTFLLDYLPYVSSDGMEHRNSSVITSARPFTRETAEQQLGSVAHEFFHSWNVKRIRPRSLQPFDYERVNMSGELWFAEGFTEYYGPLVLERAGLSSSRRIPGECEPCDQHGSDRSGTRGVQRGRYEPAGGVSSTERHRSRRRIRRTYTFRITPTGRPSRWESTWRFARSSPASRWMTGCARCGASIPISIGLTPRRISKRLWRKPPGMSFCT